jgi:hypothetical protein
MIRDNVIDNWAGAGLITVEGNESFNYIEHNFIEDITGTNARSDTGEPGTQGTGIWLSGPNNYVLDNVVTTIGSGHPGLGDYGYTLYFNGAQVAVPLFQGADLSQAGQSTTIDVKSTPLLSFSGNEVYGATAQGLTYWYLNAGFNNARSGGPSTIQGLRVWNTFSMAVFGYYSNQLTFDGLVAHGNFGLATTTLTYGVYLADYFTQNFTIQNSDIEGYSVGYYPSTQSGSTQTIKDSYLRNNVDIQVNSLWTSDANASYIMARTIYIENDKFDAAPGVALESIQMLYQGNSGGSTRNLVAPDQVFVTDYNQTPGDNFRVYYTQQAANYIVPQTTMNPSGLSPHLIGSPVSGLTNAQAWAQYGIAIAGAVAPATATTMPGIDGLVAPS